MGVSSYELEITSSVPAAKLYKALVIDADILFPKIMPQAFNTVEIIQGNGGPGTIKKVTFGQGSNFKYMKDKIEAMDKENLTFSHSVIEGDLLSNVLEKITYDIKFEQSSSTGGCTIRETSKYYYTVDDSEISVDELKAGKEKALGMFKAVEAYILANPHA
ncbi:major allergen Pru ar 1-like [Euphorbia lathyris]|uniref:major allergen Pru ar 1-like n=1 Tax=Euphorbia lathyris TaxID=212925 RepID=UPI0033134543